MDDGNQMHLEKLSQESEAVAKTEEKPVLKWSTSQVEGGSCEELEPVEFEVTSLNDLVMTQNHCNYNIVTPLICSLSQISNLPRSPRLPFTGQFQ